MRNMINGITLLTVVVLAMLRHAHGFGYARWKYTSYLHDPTDFYVHEPVLLEYISESSLNETDGALVIYPDVEWSVAEDAGCELSSPHEATTNITCDTTGEKIVSLIRNNDTSIVDVFAIDMRVCSCYNWHVALSTAADFSDGTFYSGASAVFLSEEAHVRVWVVDMHTMSTAERDRTAVLPSAPSRSVTSEIHGAGNEPMIRIGGGPPGFIPYTAVDTDNWVYYESTAENGGSYWQTTMRTSRPENVLMTVDGNGAAVAGCGVKKAIVNLGVAKYDQAIIIESNTDDAVATLTALDSFPVRSTTKIDIRFDACAPNIAIALLPEIPRAVLMTQTSFTSMDIWQFDFLDSDQYVYDASLSSETVLLLTSDNELWNYHVSDSVQSRCIVEETGNNLVADRLMGQRACQVMRQHDCTPTPSNDYVFAWTEASWNEYYFSANSSEVFVTATIPSSIGGVTYDFTALLDIYTAPMSSDIHMFLLDSDSGQYIVMRDMAMETWAVCLIFDSSQPLYEGSSGALARFTPSAQGSMELYIYADHMFYSPDAGLTAIQLTFTNRNAALHPEGDLDSGEFILDVVTGTKGHVAMMTSSHRLFYGVAGLPALIELQSSLAPNCLLIVRPMKLGMLHNDLVLFQGFVEEPYIAARMIPTENELLSTQYPLNDAPESCPYTSVSCDLDSKLSYLDMNEQLVSTVSVQMDRMEALMVSVGTSDSSRIQFVRNNTWTPVSDNSLFFQYNTDITITETPPDGVETREERIVRTVGNVDVRVGVYPSNLACDKTQLLNRVAVGCAPGRHIRVRLTEEYQCNGRQVEPHYVESRNGEGYCDDIDFGLEEQTEYTAQELRTMWPCQQIVYHQAEGFRPIIDLYDGNTFVRELTANYVMWEVTGRDDYTFNATIEQVGCVSQPVTWGELNRNEMDPWEWTPEYMRDCFTADANRPLQDTSKAYPIMNSTGLSYLTFPPTGKDGRFYFRVQVVDPAYSYCELKTRFALDVYGEPLSRTWVLLIVLFATLLMLLGLVLTYYIQFKKLLDTEDDDDGDDLKED